MERFVRTLSFVGREASLSLVVEKGKERQPFQKAGVLFSSRGPNMHKFLLYTEMSDRWREEREVGSRSLADQGFDGYSFLRDHASLQIACLDGFYSKKGGTCIPDGDSLFFLSSGAVAPST